MASHCLLECKKRGARTAGLPIRFVAVINRLSGWDEFSYKNESVKSRVVHALTSSFIQMILKIQNTAFFNLRIMGSKLGASLLHSTLSYWGKNNFLSRNYQEFNVWKMWILWKMRFWNCEFCKTWDFKKCEFCEKWDFENVNLIKNEIFQMWIFG